MSISVRPTRGSLTILLIAYVLTMSAACDDTNSRPASPATPTASPSASASATAPPTETPPASPTSTSTATPQPTDTVAPPNPTPTVSATQSRSATPSLTPTEIPTQTATASATPTFSPSVTATPTFTASPTPSVFEAVGSVEQVYVRNGPPGMQIDLLDADSQIIDSGTTDEYGSYIFREVQPGEDYAVEPVALDAGSRPALPIITGIRVLGLHDHPGPDFYTNQTIGAGYGYLETRDGTLLAINVILPGPIGNGPFPTVIEYSGYDPANPTAPQPSMLMASVLGYAVVGVNMRGTGCSGGAFDFFEPLQWLDGYDAIEAIAAQPWVRGNRVGMVGVSYPGISQLFVAQMQPPSLAAIAPLSVISDIGRGILFPGGILNVGFAVEWAAERKREAEPGGQPWSQVRLDAGDQVCIANQRLRSQTPNILQKIDDNRFYIPEVADPLSPATFVDRIDIPVFLAGAWQDEQTGGYFPNMLDRFDAAPVKHFAMTNGGHIDSIDPENFARWIDFLALYVAREVPRRPLLASTILNFIAAELFGVRALQLPPERFIGVSSYEEALAIYESAPKVRILFESGGGAIPGAPNPTFIAEFDEWPIPQTQPTVWYLDAHSTLSESPPESSGADTYRYDTSRSLRTTLEGSIDEVWRALPAWDWPHPETGRAVAYTSAPLDEPLVMIGSGSVDLWLVSDAPDVDIQVSLTEVRSDGKEVYIQSGWLRTSRRKLDPLLSTELRPVATHLEVDAAPLLNDEYEEVRIELFPFAHVFRPGSQVRVIIDTPGASRPRWRFETLEYEFDVVNTIARSSEYPSRVVLPVIPGIEVPAELPACPGLRGQPCRDALPWSNESN